MLSTREHWQKQLDGLVAEQKWLHEVWYKPGCTTSMVEHLAKRNGEVIKGIEAAKLALAALGDGHDGSY